MAELFQRGHVHLLELVQKDKAAVRVEPPDDGRGHPELVAAGHIPPALAFISKSAVLHTQLRQGQVGTVQQGQTLFALLLEGIRKLVVVAGVLGGFVLGAGFFEVGPDFPVRLLDALDRGFQLSGGFVLKVFGRFPGGVEVSGQRGLLFRQMCKLCFQLLPALCKGGLN